MRRPALPRSPTGYTALTGSPGTGGWSFALDPDLTAAAAPALWRPRACAHVTIARPAPRGYAALRLAEVVGSARVAAEWLAHREWHLVLVADGRRHRLAVRRCVANERLAYISPADIEAGHRAAMIMDLHRALLGLRAPSATGSRAGPSEHWRLIQWLRLLDAADDRASAREIAAVLLMEDARAWSASTWDASSERRRIARWQRAARAMRDGGYRTLLMAS